MSNAPGKNEASQWEASAKTRRKRQSVTTDTAGCCAAIGQEGQYIAASLTASSQRLAAVAEQVLFVHGTSMMLRNQREVKRS